MGYTRLTHLTSLVDTSSNSFVPRSIDLRVRYHRLIFIRNPFKAPGISSTFMSPEANSKSKGGKANANANNDADSIMPLLFATIGNPAISFKEMAAMDELGRTESSLEHRFRKWRQKGREIAAKNSAHAGALRTSNAAAATTKKPRISAKKGADGSSKGPIEQAGVEDEEDEEGETNEMV